MLSPTDDFVQLTSHIQHQLVEAGRDANPISAMFDTLAHPLLDTHRGEYPSFLEWKSSHEHVTNKETSHHDTHASVIQTPSTSRSHVVLGRGQVGGIWADMENDHNQTLSYSEHMELPLYSFTEFMRDHPEHGQILERPLRSTVSAYYKAYVQKTGIQSNFSNYTVVTAVYHLKDLSDHCCCSLDPHPLAHDTKSEICQQCRPYRYAVLGYVDNTASGNNYTRKRTKFLIRCKTLILSTGTFDQPKKLAAVSAHPCQPPSLPTPMIQQTFHDCRQLEEWMARHDRKPALEQSHPISPPLSPSPNKYIVPCAGSGNDKTGPIIIVGTGLSAADAILLIQETQPWRRIIHIYRYYTASEPSPLKRCHKDVYPEYNSVWLRMKKSATLRNSVQAYTRGSRNTIFGESLDCAQCKAIQDEECINHETNPGTLPVCSSCSYRGLPDASISSFDPLTGEAVLILSHGVVVKENVAAVGVFIGKQVHMGFLKGSLAQEMLSTSAGPIGPELRLLSQIGRRRRSDLGGSDSMDILTPPCTPPRSPVLKPKHQEMKKQFWQKQALKCAQALCRKTFSRQEQEIDRVKDTECDDSGNKDEEEENEDEEDEEEPVQQSQVLTLLRPLVSDMYSFRIIPTNTSPASTTIPDVLSSSRISKPKKCMRLPCYPIRPTEIDSCTKLPLDSQKTVALQGSSCISMPCSPLLGSRRVICPSLSIPPLLSLCASASASASVSVATAVSVYSSEKTVSTSPSSPCSSLASQSPCSSVATSASSSTTSLLLTTTDLDASSSIMSIKTGLSCCDNMVVCCTEEDGCCEFEVEGVEAEIDLEQEQEPLMDQSLYAAGAITGSKFVRYVLGNGVAIVADILKSERAVMTSA
ncbi:Oxidative stress-induced growth inhibitor 2 [Podila clonocystis]|nr:Oxidative stress-induced growth inhibitor 2 [Podila clonocystis]